MKKKKKSLLLKICECILMSSVICSQKPCLNDKPSDTQKKRKKEKKKKGSELDLILIN
jgi:hypothetical protein